MRRKPKKQENLLLYLACLRQVDKGYSLDMVNEYMMTYGIPEKDRSAVLDEVKKELARRGKQ